MFHNGMAPGMGYSSQPMPMGYGRPGPMNQFSYGPMGYGRGGMSGYGPMPGYGAPMGGYGRGMGGGFRGGMHAPRRRKQFVGGTLESQREWERQNLCCFFLQGQCKFGERCRYSHEDDGTKGCQFGLSCRVGHGSRNSKVETGGELEGAPAPVQQVPQ